MLEAFFESKVRLLSVRRGPLAEHVDSLASKLQRAGYTRSNGRKILTLVGKFNNYVRLKGVERAGDIDEALIGRFLEEELAEEGVFSSAPNTLLRHLMDHLRQEGVVPMVCEPPLDEDGKLLDKYMVHLRDVGGLALSTRNRYQTEAWRLLKWFRERHGSRPMSGLSGPDVLAYITEMSETCSNAAGRQLLCSNTRSFLRYLRWAEIVDTDLSRVVPKVPRWRLDTVPRHLPWEKVRALIDSVDTTTPDGMRDKAVLLLLAELGLRNGEVRSLEVGDIAWHAGELRVRRTKTRRERVLPLPHEVGAALAEYLLHGRPSVDMPQIFVRHVAPMGPYKSAGAIGRIIAKHLQRTGITAPSRGAHLLRHSLATRMVNVGVPIKTIADVLGHTSIGTTAIYTKVDINTLTTVALPFPGGAS
jgi:site-specific recombinase XerD